MTGTGGNVSDPRTAAVVDDRRDLVALLEKKEQAVEK